MPAAVAIPLISTAIGAGTSIIQQKMANKKASVSGPSGSGGLASRARTAKGNIETAMAGSGEDGGGGGSSYSSGSWSRGGTVIDPAVRDLAFNAASGFLNDGGLSQQDLASMRSRALSPARAAYADASREINRSAALAGGYAPNRIAALARMSRERGQNLADAATNAEAGIVGMRQQGKIAGLNAATSMYANMPTFNESESWSSGGSSGGGGSEIGMEEEQGPGFWDYVRGGAEAVLPPLLGYLGKRNTGINIPPPVVDQSGWGKLPGQQAPPPLDWNW